MAEAQDSKKGAAVNDEGNTCDLQGALHISYRNGRSTPKLFFTQGTKDLLKDIGGGGRIRSMCTRFYAKAFKDSVLSKFMFETDDAKAHGKRLGDWIVEKMGGII